MIRAFSRHYKEWLKGWIGVDALSEIVSIVDVNNEPMAKHNANPFEITIHEVKIPEEASFNPYTRSSRPTDPVESFEEWKLRVSELDNAVRNHLRPTKSDNWRLIDVPVMLGQWRGQRRFDRYLHLVERWLYTLMAFEAGGSLTTKIVIQHLHACEIFLRGPLGGSEEERNLADRVVSLREKLERARAKAKRVA